LLYGNAGAYACTGLLPASQAIVSEWGQPNRQYGEGFLTRPASSAAHPDAFVAVIVRAAAPLSVADNGHALAQGASSGQMIQRNYPGSQLSFVSGSAIKRIMAGVKACR